MGRTFLAKHSAAKQIVTDSVSRLGRLNGMLVALARTRLRFGKRRGMLQAQFRLFHLGGARAPEWDPETSAKLVTKMSLAGTSTPPRGRKRYQTASIRAAAESFPHKIERNPPDRDRPDGQTRDRNRRAHTPESLASDVRGRVRR